MKTRSQNMFVAWALLALTIFQHSTAFAQGGTWLTEAPMPTARYGSASGVINGKLYVASGATVDNSPPYPKFTNLEVYDPVANTWATNAPIPVGIYSATAGVIHDKLFVAGGQAAQNQGGNLDTLQVYDPQSDTWTTDAPMPFASSATCGAVIDGILYVAGGENPANDAAVSNLVAYDSDSDTWSIEAPLPMAIIGAAAGVVDGILYVVGGMDSRGVVTNAVEAYDPNTDSWAARSPMPTARYFLAVGVAHGILYAVGGVNGSQVLNNVEVYNPAADTWTTLTPMPTARYLPVIGALNRVLYTVGGNNAPGSPASDNLAVNEAFFPSGLPVCLSIAYTNNSAIVSWPYSSADYVLQTNSDLAGANWGIFVGNIATNFAGSNSVTITPPVGNLFFRLGP